MPRRNFILLIIILILVIAGLFGFLYLRSGKTPIDVVTSGTNFLNQFNPFASNNTPKEGDNNTNALDTNGDGTVTEEELAMVKLKKISTIPIAGFTVFNKERLKEVPVPIVPVATEGEAPAETTPVVAPKKPTTQIAPATEFMPALRYVERATGNVYQTFADKIEERRFSETIIPKIYDAYFGNHGESVVLRHLKSDDRTIETFSGLLPKEKIGEDLASNQLKGSFLVDGIKDISLSPDTTKIFYLSNLGDSAIGTILNLNDTKRNQVFNSAFTEWNSFWPNSKTITLTTKPSGLVPGYMYMIDVDKKNFTKVLGDINGLTTLMSPNGKLVLVGNGSLSLFVYHTDSKTYEQIGVNTLPEKCTWNKTNEVVYCAVPTFVNNATYPDDWYRGEISFSDQIWRINLRDGNTTMIADPVLVSGGEDIDGVKLALDDDEKYLFLVNKKDSFLWELELN